MILAFPDLDTFRLAVTGGLVPAEAMLAEAAVSTDPVGRLLVETPAKLSRKIVGDLGRLGVTTEKRHAGATEFVSCWLQVLPTVRDANPPQLSSQAPVLFELPTPESFPTLVTEMLRLGNDRQSCRWLAPADGRDEPRVLLRVIGPPYYTLLRALDPAASGDPVIAYAEAAPRVWVQVGYSHPLADRIRPPEGQMLLIRPPRTWAFAEDAGFRDVYDVLDFQLPSAAVAWEPAAVEKKLTVPLTLVAGNATDVPDLWVLRGPEAAGHLDTYVRDADERLAQRLKFAVATDPAGSTVIVLRTAPSKLAPPPLVIPGAVGYRPYWKLPNLYVPAGTRLHPTLRRDAVRTRLADDPDRLVWLNPGANGAFTPESLPEDSFRPLEDWVDYVIETNHEPLTAWVDAARFAFDAFVCSDNAPPPKPKDPDKGAGKPRRPEPKASSDSPVTPTKPEPSAEGTAAGPEATAFVPEARPPSEWRIKRSELEREFLQVDGPLDAPARQALWTDLANANAGCGDVGEAAVCWVNALWAADPAPPAWLDAWATTELGSSLPSQASDFDALMASTDPSPAEVRTFAAAFLALAARPLPKWFSGKLPAIRAYLEAHERKLPVRVSWLTAARLAALSGSDVLGLARARDRLLSRLLEDGLNPERDLPSFLRYAGLADSDRIREVREKAIELHKLCRTWVEHGVKPRTATASSEHGTTVAYVDLMFAFGLAKLGEASTAHVLAEAGEKILANVSAGDSHRLVASYLGRAFHYRIAESIAGKPHVGPLPIDLRDEFDAMQASGKANFNDPKWKASYMIARFREQSEIVDPQEKLEPYRIWSGEHRGELFASLNRATVERNPDQLAKRLRSLHQDGAKDIDLAEARFHVLKDGLPLAPRVGEAFVLEMLGSVPAAIQSLGKPAVAKAIETKDQGLLLERAIFFAAHYDRRDLVETLVGQFVCLVTAMPDAQRNLLINLVAKRCLRSLRKLGLRDEIDRLLRRLQQVLLKGQPVAAVRTSMQSAKGDAWSGVLQALLHLAGGWLSYGLVDQAVAILDEARTDLLATGTRWQNLEREYTLIARAYVSACGQGPVDVGLPRIVELFAKMDPNCVKNAFSTSEFYSRLHLSLVEEVVLALVSDEYALGPGGRRWLDDDEYLVRKRVHADVKRLVGGT